MSNKDKQIGQNEIKAEVIDFLLEQEHVNDINNIFEILKSMQDFKGLDFVIETDDFNYLVFKKGRNTNVRNRKIPNKFNTFFKVNFLNDIYSQPSSFYNFFYFYILHPKSKK